jgi:hypothetical protein
VQKLEHSFHSFFATEFLPFVVGTGEIKNDPSPFKSLRSMHHYTLIVCTLATTALLTRIILTLIRCLVHYPSIFQFQPVQICSLELDIQLIPIFKAQLVAVQYDIFISVLSRMRTRF